MLSPILRFLGLKRPLEEDSDSPNAALERRPSSKARTDAPASPSPDAPASSTPTPNPTTPSELNDTPSAAEETPAAPSSSTDPTLAPPAATDAPEQAVVVLSSDDDEEEEEEEEEVRGVPVASLKSIKELWDLDVFEEATTTAFPHNQQLNEKVVIWRGDITSLKVDAIVNAANRALLGGGGVDGAIHSAAGRGLYQECKLLNGAETGESKITGGHRLAASRVIHTVGPIYSRAQKERCERDLRSCYQSTLELAVANNCKSLAFSGISTGIYGYPLDDATRVALGVTRAFLESPAGASLDRVVFTVFRQIDVNSYNDIAPEFFPPPPAVVESKEVEEVKEAEAKEIETGTTELHLESQDAVKADGQ